MMDKKSNLDLYMAPIAREEWMLSLWQVVARERLSPGSELRCNFVWKRKRQAITITL